MNKQKVVLVEERKTYRYTDQKSYLRHKKQMDNDGWNLVCCEEDTETAHVVATYTK